MKTFKGYRRSDGSIGVRNHVIVMNTVGELAAINNKLAELVPGVIPISHQAGQAQYSKDFDQTVKTLKGIVGHPNVYATLILGMDGDHLTGKMRDLFKNEERNVNVLTFQKNKSISTILNEAKQWLEKTLEKSKVQKRETADVSELIIGLQCGGSDGWSGITANPSIGAFSDLIIEDGGISILAETTEAIGAEHIIAQRSINLEVSNKFLQIIKDCEDRINAIGEYMRSDKISPGNMEGGLTTLEEKSLGCMRKGGSTTLMEVVDYAETPTQKGFIFMDTPGYDVQSVTGLVAGGAQIILFSTGKGSPTGSPIAPVLKIGTNPKLYEQMSELIDVNAGKILEGSSTIPKMGEEIYEKVIEVSNGSFTASEKNENREFSIWRLAETM